MNLEEAINSDDIEIAKLAATILRKQKGKSYVGNLIKKYNKYEFKKGEGLVKKHNVFENLSAIFSKWKIVNTPLVNMIDNKNNVIYTNEDADTITFDVPYKIDEK